MDSENLKKWGCLIAFLILMGISCWATEHSLKLLLGTSFPVIFVWALTIAMFVVASYGTKLIVDSLNMDIYIKHRRRSFWLGAVLVLFFWLIVSMPTNTHTFFFNHSIGDMITQDKDRTCSYLGQLSGRVNTDPAYMDVFEEVDSKWKAAAREYNGLGTSGQKGAGQYFQTLVRDINGSLGRAGADEGHLVVVVDNYNQFNAANLETYEKQVHTALHYIEDNYYKVGKNAAREAGAAARDINTVYNDEENGVYKLLQSGSSLPADIVDRQEATISKGYTLVKVNQKYVNFENDADRELYTAENITTRTKRMISVFDVWKDFLSGKYPFSFVYYIILSILVDVAAFMFFDFAFKKND